MRTKHILTALVLPALFAACTADDFNEPITGNGVADRALLSEDFKLNFGGADTRFSAGEGSGLEFSYEVGDSIGGAIIDSYTPGTGGAEDKYDVVSYISTNHPFVLDANGEWAINHTMVEGNYLFYYPYNQQNHARGAIRYSIPVMQDLSGKDGAFDPKAAIEKYNMGVAAQFLDKEDLNANVQLVNIFGYAKLKIALDNAYAGGEVDKIVLMPADASKYFHLNGQINNNAVSVLFAEYGKDAKKFQTALEAKTTTASFCLDNTATGYYDEELNTPSPVIVAKAPAGTKMEVNAQNIKTFETYIVMPAANYGSVDIYLYTTDGDVYKGGDNINIVRNAVTTVEGDLDSTNELIYVVTSEKDWNDYVSLLKKNDVANFIIATEDFSVTNTTKFPTNGAEIRVSGNLNISGDDVKDMQYITAEKITVKKGAKLTTNGTINVGKWVDDDNNPSTPKVWDQTDASVENNGTLVVTPAYDENDKVINYEGLGKVINNPGASLTVEAETVAAFVLENEIDATDEDMAHGTVTVNGELALNAGSYNDGEMTIAATGEVSGTLSNNGEYIYPAGAADDDVKGRFTPSIVNNGTILAMGEMSNEGDITNNKGAEISCDKRATNAKFVNLGKIDAKDGSKLLITENANTTDEGEVILEKLGQQNWDIEGAQGIIAYTMGASDKSIDFTTTGKGITKLYVNADLTITKYGDLKNIVVAADATLTVPAAVTLAEMTVEEGAEATIVATPAKTGDPAATTISSLTVEEDAVLNVNNPNELTATAVNNDGTIYVGGKFTTSTLEGEAGEGTFRTTSNQGSITFGKTTPTGDEAKFYEAIGTFVNEWLENTKVTGVDSWDDVTVEKIAASTWDTTSGWNGNAATALVNAYKAWKTDATTTNADVPELLNEYEAEVKDAISAAEAAANKKLAEELAEMNNAWLSGAVYVQAKAGDALNKIMSTTNTTTSVDAGFKTYLTETKYTTKPMSLSANDYKVTAVPAYSYIETYETANVYKVVATLLQFVGTSGQWNANITESKLKEKGGVVTAYEILYNEYNKSTSALGASDKLLIKNSGIVSDELATEILTKWNYTTDQVTYLIDEVIK